MSPALALLIGAGLGMVAGTLLIPLTRRELTASLARAATADAPAAGEPAATSAAVALDAPDLGRRQ